MKATGGDYRVMVDGFLNSAGSRARFGKPLNGGRREAVKEGRRQNEFVFAAFLFLLYLTALALAGRAKSVSATGELNSMVW
jgi:hypothetical protein